MEISQTILLAEDEESVRHLLHNVLHREGYVVLPAADGHQAIGAATRHEGPIHLLLSDIVMPGMDGTELARRLQAQRPDLKVLLISAYDSGGLVMDKRWSFLRKPFLPVALVEKVRSLLRE